MFPPDADHSSFAAKGDSPGLRAIKHNNTRLPSPVEESLNGSEPPTPSRSLIGAAIAGTPCKHHRLCYT
jgi:protein DGCR14